MSELSRRGAIGAVAAAAAAMTMAPQQAQSQEQARRQRRGQGDPPEVRAMSLDEFKAMQVDQGIQAIMGKMNGGTFMYCHCRVAEEAGIWIDELVPVFQKLDAQLVFADLPEFVPRGN